MSLNHSGKSRWTAEWRVSKTWQLIAPPGFIKLDSRPSFTIDSQDYWPVLQNPYVPSPVNIPPVRSTWGETKMNYFDYDKDVGGTLLFHWIAEQYKATNEINFIDINAVAGRFLDDNLIY